MTAGVAAGDPAAVEAFYRRYFDWLCREASRCTRRDEATTLDVVQKAVLRVMRTLRPVDSEASLKAWLRLVVRAAAYDHLRSEQRRSVRESKFASRPKPAQPSPADAAAVAEQLAWLHEQLTNLDPRLLRIIDLRYRRGWTLQRISDALGGTTGSVDGQLRRALKQMRKRVIEDDPPAPHPTPVGDRG